MSSLVKGQKTGAANNPKRTRQATHRLKVSLTAEQHRRLKRTAALTRRSMSDVLVKLAIERGKSILVVTLSPEMRGLIDDIKAIEATADSIARAAHQDLLSADSSVALASRTLASISEIKSEIQGLLKSIANSTARNVAELKSPFF